MKTYYKKDLKATYLILKGNDIQMEDYQVVMLRENDIPGICKMEVRNIDNQSYYYYNISGKTTFKTLHEKVGLNYEKMRRLVNSLLATTEELQRYMLDGNSLLLEPEYIFCDKEQFYFCYYPFYQGDVKEAFHRLTEFFVREVNYQDEEGVQLAYTLHKSTMEENYSIDEIMRQFACETEKREEETVLPVMAEITEDFEEQEEEMEKNQDRWEFVRRFLERRRLVKKA